MDNREESLWESIENTIEFEPNNKLKGKDGGFGAP
jgi:hypothetical protein